MKPNSRHAKLLKSIHEGEILTKQELFQRAGVNDQNLLRLLVQADLFEQLGWNPKEPNKYRITKSGVERQQLYARP